MWQAICSCVVVAVCIIVFNLGGQAHELGVKQMAYHLWSRYSLSHKVWFITVDFEPVVAEILKTIDDGHMGVVLKRMMVKAASQIAQQIKIQALVTGEAMGQVASQTLTNLNAIDAASSTLILRPLITSDKEDIIKMAEKLALQTLPSQCLSIAVLSQNHPRSRHLSLRFWNKKQILILRF